ncbi:MAG: hypothetical protein AAF663_01750 [Planctomycetota bacterium]
MKLHRCILKFGRKVCDYGRQAAAKVKATAAAATATVLAAAGFGGDAAAQYAAPTDMTFNTVIDPAVLAAGALGLGGLALAAAFTTGGGFRIAKKTYSWIMNKI